MQGKVVNLAPVVLIREEAAGGKGFDTLDGFMLKEGDGCSPAVSHIPAGSFFQRGPPGSVLLSSLLPPRPPSGLLHSCPLRSFNIWSLFSVSNTRATGVTPLLKMPRIGTFYRDGERKKKRKGKVGCVY